MNAKELIEKLKDIDGQVYIQQGDNAYPAKVRIFEERVVSKSGDVIKIYNN